MNYIWMSFPTQIDKFWDTASSKCHVALMSAQIEMSAIISEARGAHTAFLPVQIIGQSSLARPVIWPRWSVDATRSTSVQRNSDDSPGRRRVLHLTFLACMSLWRFMLARNVNRLELLTLCGEVSWERAGMLATSFHFWHQHRTKAAETPNMSTGLFAMLIR